jgi:hypothetical protein
MAVLLGRGYYDSLLSGALTVKGRTSRRDHEPISYWLGMFAGAVAFLTMVFGAVLMAFFVYVDLYRR